VYGIDAYLVEVEVDVGSARMQDFNVVGLPDNAVKESRERIKSALRNCGFEFPYGQGVTINLAPADVRKEGSEFDLPMALGLAGCMGQFFGKPLDQCMLLGELSLDGGVRPVRGALSAALAARDRGLKSIAVPEANAREAAVVEGVSVFALKSLPQQVDLVNSPESFTPVKVEAGQMLSEAAQYNVDLRDVHGQQAAKRALEVSCAGGHNILFIGRDDLARRHIGDVSVALHACCGNESLSMRIFRGPHQRMPLHAADDSTICVKDFGATARPHRHTHSSAGREIQRAPSAHVVRGFGSGTLARDRSARPAARAIS
jgi:Subunit ChlI of Mg-chelatase/Magnesium chelatase, subunit ChlI